jgi:hypothetical protein
MEHQGIRLSNFFSHTIPFGNIYIKALRTITTTTQTPPLRMPSSESSERSDPSPKPEPLKGSESGKSKEAARRGRGSFFSQSRGTAGGEADCTKLEKHGCFPHSHLRLQLYPIEEWHQTYSFRKFAKARLECWPWGGRFVSMPTFLKNELEPLGYRVKKHHR